MWFVKNDDIVKCYGTVIINNINGCIYINKDSKTCLQWIFNDDTLEW